MRTLPSYKIEDRGGLSLCPWPRASIKTRRYFGFNTATKPRSYQKSLLLVMPCPKTSGGPSPASDRKDGVFSLFDGLIEMVKSSTSRLSGFAKGGASTFINSDLDREEKAAH